MCLHAGIVQGQGQVEAVDSKDDFSSIRIRFPPGKLDGVHVGASVAVNGTCLTVRLQLHFHGSTWAVRTACLHFQPHNLRE